MNDKKKILIVDDDLELCQVIKDTLSEKGYHVTFVQNAEDALELSLSDLPDLMLLDIEVPKMGGFVFCQKLRSNVKTKDLPVIFLSVRDSDFDKQTAMSFGADLYITKPFRRSHLLKEVETLLSGKKSIENEKTDFIQPPSTNQESSTIISVGEGSPPIKRKEGLKILESLKKITVPLTKKFKSWISSHPSISWVIVSLVIAGLVFGSIAIYKLFNKEKKDPTQTQDEATLIAVNVMQVAPAPFQDILSAVGTVAGGSEIELRFQTEGNIQLINFKEGSPIQKGQVIAQLDQKQVLLRLEKTRSEFFRYEKLYALGGVSKDRLEEARVQHDYAQSELEKTVLRAPQDGIFGDKGVEVGEFVTSQKKVGTLVSLKTVLIRVGVIEKEIDKIFPGLVVLANVETYPEVEFKGKVENISPLIQGQSKTLTVEARFPNDGKLLLPGMFARTRIIIYENESVISVPNDSLEKTEQGYQLYVVGKENKAEARPVEVSYIALTHSVISKGIQPGEQIITQRPQGLKAGSPLKIIESEKSVDQVPQIPQE